MRPHRFAVISLSPHPSSEASFLSWLHTLFCCLPFPTSRLFFHLLWYESWCHHSTSTSLISFTNDLHVAVRRAIYNSLLNFLATFDMLANIFLPYVDFFSLASTTSLNTSAQDLRSASSLLFHLRMWDVSLLCSKSSCLGLRSCPNWASTLYSNWLPN